MRYEFDMKDAYRFAMERGIQCKQKGSELLFMNCPYCNGGKHNDKWTFSINLNTGAFNCPRASCNAKGNMLSLVKDFGFQLSDKVMTEWVTRSKPPKNIKIPQNISEPIKPDIEKFLETRGISAEIGNRYHLKMHKDKPNLLVFPFFSADGKSIQFIKYRDMNHKQALERWKQGGEQGGKPPKEFPERNMTPVLYGMDLCDPKKSEDIVITEGQMDALAIAEAFRDRFCNVVSVPMGVNNMRWIPYCWTFLSQFKKIILFSDFENGKHTMVDEFQKRFGNRLYLVRPSDYQGHKDANDILLSCGRGAIVQAITNAERIKDNASIYWTDIDDQPEKLETIPTGIKDLDSLLNGGIPMGGVTILSGRGGEGKTTLAEQIVANAITTVSGYYNAYIYSEEMSVKSIRNCVLRQIAGGNNVIGTEYERFDGVKTVGYMPTRSATEKIRRYIQPEQLGIYDSDRLDYDESDAEQQHDLLQLFEDKITGENVRLIVVDSLMTALARVRSSGKFSDKYEYQTYFVNKCRHLAKKYNVSIVLIAHQKKGNDDNKGDSISGASEIRNLSSCVLFYNIPTDAEKTKYMVQGNPADRLIVVDKCRGNEGRTGVVPVLYEEKSKRIYITETDRDREYIPFEDADMQSIITMDGESPFE